MGKHLLSQRLRLGARQALALAALMLLLGLSLPSAAKDLAKTQAELDQVKRKISQLDHWLKDANKEKSGLAAQLRKEEKEIDQISRAIRANQQDIATLLRLLAQLENDFKKQQEALAKQKDHYAAQIRASYLQDQQPSLKLLLNSDNPLEAVRHMRYLGYLNQARSEKISEFERALLQLEQTESELLAQKTQLGQTRETLSENQKQLSQRAAQRRQTLAKLDREIKTEGRKLDSLKADQKRLENLTKEIQKALAQIKLQETPKVVFGKQKAQLPWPTRGKVLAGFGSQLVPGKLSSQGIRIATAENAPIRAVHDGRVVFSDWLRGFGLLLIIDHGNGFMSLYGNNQSLVRNTGDRVKAEDVIAYARASNEDRESGLYFEIRKNGKPENPLLWLKR